MRDIPYYPGCTLTMTAKNLDDSARAAMMKLDVNLAELPRWNCCGTVSTLTSDNLMDHLGPIRVLTRTQEIGSDKLATLCTMCYSTLKRSNLLVRTEPDRLEKINSFMDREEDYRAGVEVLHLLEILRDEVGYQEVKNRVAKELEGLKVVCYYGCLLTRPKDIAMDDVEAPTALEDLVTSLGAESIDDPYALECCGSYHTVGKPDLVDECSSRILVSAVDRGADVIVTSCPLCQFNLDECQKRLLEKDGSFRTIPVLYFTQLMALALGQGEDVCHFDIHHVDPRPMLTDKGLL
jgi:heterodisulfide reductase subunit B